MDKKNDYTNLIEFIEYTLNIDLDNYQKEFLKYLVNQKNNHIIVPYHVRYLFVKNFCLKNK